MVRRIRDERGASAVEFAIIASLLFMILFGTIQFGIIFNRYQGLQASGREGARFGSLDATTADEILARVKNSVSIVAADNVTLCGSGAWGSTPSLSLDNGCVRVWRRPGPSVTTPTQHTATGTPGPCEASQIDSGGKSVIVEVFLRTKLDIVLWASPEMTIKGVGEFRCEG